MATTMTTPRLWPCIRSSSSTSRRPSTRTGRPQLKRQLAGQAQENKRKLQKQAEDFRSSMSLLQNRLQELQHAHAASLKQVQDEFSDVLTQKAEKEIKAEQQMKILQTEKGHLQELLSVTQKGLAEREAREKTKLQEKLVECLKTNNEVAQQEYKQMRQEHQAAQQAAKRGLTRCRATCRPRRRKWLSSRVPTRTWRT